MTKPRIAFYDIRKVIIAFVCAIALIAGPVTSASADDGQKISKEQLAHLKNASSADREKVRKAAVDKYTEKFCDVLSNQVVALPGQNPRSICEDDVGKQLDKTLDTPEKALQEPPALNDICGGVSGANMHNPGLKASCAVASIGKAIFSAVKPVVDDIISSSAVQGIINAVHKAAAVTKFFANPADSFEQLANHAHDEAVKWTTQVMEDVTHSTDFSGSQEWFMNSWAAGAGVGVLLLGLMFLLMIRDLGSGEIDEDEFRNSLLRWGPAAMMVAVFGPAFMSKLATMISSMNHGIIAARGGALTEKIINFCKTITTMDSASSGLGALVGILVFILMIIAALVLYIVFILQHFALILMAYGIAIMLGCLINPKWRSGVLKAASTWVMILFSKPVLLIMMALVFTVPFGEVSGSGGLGLLAQIVLVILAMGAVAFSPMLLVKYVPMVSAPGSSPWVNGAPDVGRPGPSEAPGGNAPETDHMTETTDRANQRSRSESVTNDESSSRADTTTGSSRSNGGPSTPTDEGTAENSSAPVGSKGATNAQRNSGKPSSSASPETAQREGSSGSSEGSELANTGPAPAADAGGGTAGGSGATKAAATAGGEGATAGSSSAAGAGSSAGSSAATGAAATGAGVTTGGVAAGVLVAAAAAKKAGDTGRDMLVGLNEDAANFQDYNG